MAQQRDGLAPNKSGLSWKLWLDAEHLALKSLSHPFVTGMGDGTLPRWGRVMRGLGRMSAAVQALPFSVQGGGANVGCMWAWWLPFPMTGFTGHDPPFLRPLTPIPVPLGVNPQISL